ncbi:MAG: DNA-binding protein YbaB/EbfC family [Clostridia bacterium]|nr:DNA-binding protein YbaB/EbfC family [Clostridia bacterium]
MAKGGFQGGGMGNMNNMIKQAQKMQKDMMKVQEELEQRQIETSAGGGAITVVVTGKKELVSIKIKPEVVDADDVEMLEDLILAAVNEAIRKAEEMVSSEMGKITGGFGLPGGMF